MTRKSDTRQHLIDSAVRLIHAGSFNAVSVNELCADARVNKGSFYYYFQSKRDLTLAAIEDQWERHRDGLLEPAFAGDLPPLERINRLFELAVPFTTGLTAEGTMLGCPFGNLGVELATQDPVILEKVRDVFGRIRRYFESALSELHAAGKEGCTDVPALSHRLLAYWEGVYLLAKVENDPQVFVRMRDGALQLARGVPIP